MKPMDLVELLNDPDRSSDLTEIDKTQVYRWLRGQMPQPAMQVRIAAALGFEDEPERLLQSPHIDWVTRFFESRSIDELERMKTMLEAAFPRTHKSGTDG